MILLQIRNADPLLFLASVIIVTLTFPARAVRWRILLEAGTGTKMRFRPVWLATAIGFMANNVLPARAGEVARAYAASTLVGLPVSTSLSTIAVERIFDGITVVLLLVLGLASPEFPAGVTLAGQRLTSVAAVTGGVFLALLVALAIIAHYPLRATALVDRVTHAVLPARIADWSAKVARNLFNGLSVLRSPHEFARVLTWSFVVWGLNAISYGLAFHAFHLGDLPVTSTLVLQGIVVLGVAIPSSPGYAGIFEAACIAALGIYNVPKDLALGFALSLHMAWFIPITVLGVWALVRAGLSMGDLRAAPAAPQAS